MANPSAVLDAEPEARALRISLPSVLAPLASLRLTVTLFALSMVLVFSGTLAQMDAGIWTVVKQYFRSFFVWIPIETYLGLGRVFLGFPTSWHLPDWFGFPFPGGWTLGAALLVNLVAAHVVRFRFTRNRMGILLTHTGVALLLIGELITGLYQVEARMTIALGETVNYTDVSQHFELAFTKTGDGQSNDEVTIPASMLTKGRLISAPELPVDVEVLQYSANSEIRAARPGEPGSVTANDGRAYGINFQVQEGSGVDAQAGEDVPSARIVFHKKGEKAELAGGVFSVWFDRNISRRLASPINFPPRSINVDGNTWLVSLRPKREYKDYALQLLEFRHDKYIGTETPRNFSSLVRLTDPGSKEDRKVLIYMNSPLRYNGETFFQSGYFPDNSGTILQVVRNPGWVLPYISCTVVAIGMLWHFVPMLSRFVTRSRSVNSKGHAAGPHFLLSFEFWLAALGVIAYFAFVGWPTRDATDSLHIEEFRRLAIVDGGRIKPIDTFARNTLQAISARQEVRHEGRTLSAVQWLLDVWSSRDLFEGPAAKLPVFRIDSDLILNVLQLQARPGSYRYSIQELLPHYPELMQQFENVRKVDAKKRDLFQAKMYELGLHVSAYEDLVRLRAPRVIPPQSSTEEDWQSLGRLMEPARRFFMEGFAEEMRKHDVTPAKLSLRQLASLEGKIDELAIEKLPQISPAAASFARILDRYRANDVKEFNLALNTFRETHQQNLTAEERHRVDFESSFNQLQPFYHCAVLYVLLIVIAGCSWLGFGGPLSRLAMGLGTATFVMHTLAISARMYIQGRPPVTNLYSSAVFIGWGAVGVLLLLERLYRSGLAIMLAGVLGSASLVVAHYLGLGSDTLEMMQAVLDTNFWLATHVTAVTLGYMATFVAGFIAVAYVFTEFLAPETIGDIKKKMSSMIYGVLCFATLLSFVGTVLGGIWADQSWGRFWGWDPKENGAVLIVIWNALILHSRWGGLVKPRGIAVLAVLGNIVTAWSWFGTNQLGVGLHSYGFTSGVSTTLVVFNALMLLIAGLGLVPSHRSIRPTSASPSAVS